MSELKIIKSKNQFDKYCEPTIIISFDNHLFVNVKLTTIDIMQIWTPLEADIVIGTIVGFNDDKLICDQLVINQPINNNMMVFSSIYITNNIIGRIIAVESLLNSYIKKYKDNNNNISFRLFLKLAIQSEKYTVKFDIHQRVFGYTLFTNNNKIKINDEESVDEDKSINSNNSYNDDYSLELATTACYSNDNIIFSNQIKMFELLTNGTRLKCNIILRQTGLHGSYMGEKSFFSELFLQLERMPLIWIGNGPGLPIWKHLYNLQLNCQRHY